MRTFISRAAWIKIRPFLIGITGMVLLFSLYGFGLSVPANFIGLERTVTEALLPADTAVNVARTPAAITAILCVVLFYTLIKRWHGRRVGVMAAALFASSAWMLHTGHAANGLIFFSLVPLALFLFGSWLASAKRSGLALVAMAAVYGILLYIPGALWFEIIAATLLWPVYFKHIKQAAKKYVALAWLTYLVVVSGLVYHLLKVPAHIPEWLGLLQGLPTPFQFADQWLHSVTFLVRGPEAADLWLGHHSILDAFSIAALLLGTYMYIKYWKNMRVYLLGSFALVASLLVGLNGTIGISYLLPIVYLIIGSGLTHLLHEWYVIFPRNPVARWVGTVVISIAVIVAATYHMTAYFVAWPKAVATQNMLIKN